MKLLSHRGYWTEKSHQNSIESFQQSFAKGYGVETDIRDCLGQLVISHDPARGLEGLSVDRFFEIYREGGGNTPLALNIKSDGLQDLLMKSLQKHEIKHYFLFDMSVPDMLLWSKRGARFFTRQSEIETVPSLLDQASGVWLDCFFSDWIDEKCIDSYLQNGKEVCIVSPELHKRPHLEFWGRLKKMKNRVLDSVMLCTDFPDQAKEFFCE